MKTHNCIQGSKEWLDLRANVDGTASEASAMMGASKYMSRDDLLKIKATGESKPVDTYTQKLFDKGHATEAMIRPHIEKLVNDELYPTTGTKEFEGLVLLASYDGIDMMESVGFEHKLLSQSLIEQIENNNIDPHYYWQLEQQILISGCEKVIFVTSDGTPENMKYCWYKAVPGRAEQLIAGWKQFKLDLANYEHVPEVGTPVAADIMELPTLEIQIHGGIKSSNLVAYKNSALAFIKAINTNLKTDEDFAVAEKTVKFCDEAESRIDLVKKQALSQTVDIEQIFNSLDQLKSELRSKRLELDKLVKSQKAKVKSEIVKNASSGLAEYIASLNTSLKGEYLNLVEHTSVNLPGAIKNKRTISSIQSAVNDEIARVKIEVNAKAEEIRTNINFFNENANNYQHLFINNINYHKHPDFFALEVKNRITEFKQAEEIRLEAEREKIRKEESEKAEQKLKDEQAEKAQKQIEQEDVPACIEDIEEEYSNTSKFNSVKLGTGVTKVTSEPIYTPKSEYTRPTDLQLINCIASTFNADKDEVVTWLMDFDPMTAIHEVSKAG